MREIFARIPYIEMSFGEARAGGIVTPEVEITGLANGGDGVCRVDGVVCFVPYALPGDKVELDLRAKSRGVLRGTIREILEPSEHRSKAACDVFGKCGGCTWLHFDYPAQADWKADL